MLFFYVGTNIEVFFYMGNLQIHTRIMKTAIMLFT